MLDLARLRELLARSKEEIAKMFCRLAMVLCIVSLAFGSSVFAASPIYYLTDLGTVSGTGNSYGYALATVNGTVEMAGRTGGSSLPFTGDPAIWSGRHGNRPAFRGFRGHGGNIPGHGWCRRCARAGPLSAAKVWVLSPAGGSAATVLPVLNSSSPYGAAYGVSNNGIIAGYSTSNDTYNNYHACVWTSAGTVTDTAGW